MSTFFTTCRTRCKGLVSWSAEFIGALSAYINTRKFMVGLVKNLEFGVVQRLIFGLLDGLLVFHISI